MKALSAAVSDYADRHANPDGLVLTPVPGLRMMRHYRPGEPLRSVYKPLVCLVLQGAKELRAAGETRRLEAGQSVIVGVDMPVTGLIVEATPEQPYLAVALELDMAVMQTVATEMGLEPAATPMGPPLFSETLDETVVGCAERMLRLIHHPGAVPSVRPAILRELHYWLLASTHGPQLRRLALPDGTHHRIARAIELIRTHYREPLPGDRLAAAAHMSASAFHRHFKSVTSLTPVQFQKQLRLIEARRLILAEGRSASDAAVAVGYASPSQFSRDFRQMFGHPPSHARGTAA